MEANEEIGAALRQARESLGLSIEDAVRETKISARYLTALEEGRFGLIPGEVYVRGFIRSYAKMLHLNGDALLKCSKESPKDGPKESRPPEPPPVPPEKPAPRPPRAYAHPPRRMVFRPGRLIGLLILLLVLALLIRFVPRWLNRNAGLPGGEPVPGTSEPQTPEPEPEPEPPANNEPPAVTPPAASVTITEDNGQRVVYAVTGDTLTVAIEATEPCWIEVTSDQGAPVSLTIAAAETKTYTANTTLTLRLGNPRGVTLTANGSSAAIPGATTNPKRLIFTRQTTP